VDRVAVKGKTKGVPIYTADDSLDEKTAEAWRIHSQASERYYSRDFAGAATEFERVLTMLPGDFLAQTFLERALAYRDTPPPPDWDGVEVMTTK
jgi:adenylate cyclase